MPAEQTNKIVAKRSHFISMIIILVWCCCRARREELHNKLPISLVHHIKRLFNAWREIARSGSSCQRAEQATGQINWKHIYEMWAAAVAASISNTKRKSTEQLLSTLVWKVWKQKRQFITIWYCYHHIHCAKSIFFCVRMWMCLGVLCSIVSSNGISVRKK